MTMFDIREYKTSDFKTVIKFVKRKKAQNKGFL